MGNCYLVDNADLFEKKKVNPKFFQKNRLIQSNDEFNSQTNEINKQIFMISQNDQPDKKPDDDKKVQNCVLMKKMTDKFTSPLIKTLAELKNAVKTGKFKITFENSKKKNNEPTNDKDDKKKKEFILNFNSVSFGANDQLFPVDKYSNFFELIRANEQIKSDFILEETNSTNENLKTFNDCYLYCLNSNKNDQICHSFTFCSDSTELIKCQFSYLYFDNSTKLESFENSLKVLKDKKIQQKDVIDQTEFSKYLEKSPDCNVYNLLFRNYFKQRDDLMIEKSNTFEILENYTLEECVEQCYSRTKNNLTVNEENICRLVEYCSDEVYVNENEFKKTSTCLMTNKEARNLQKRDEERSKKNCRLYDCKFRTN